MCRLSRMGLVKKPALFQEESCVQRGSVQNMLDQIQQNVMPSPLNESVCRSILRGVSLGLQQFHAHSPPWAHRDIKPANILLSANMEPVLIDFGSVAPARLHISTRAEAMQAALAAPSPHPRPSPLSPTLCVQP